ncbi:MAG TPA: hypothetical protein VG265_13440 [Gaiellaceae bacterium]|jgi:hypothetical protein|nr:hypothetical protein [Gaiellaceae bacterium]
MATVTKKRIVAELAVKKSTQNKVVFAETDDSPAAGAIGTLYLGKYAVSRELGAARKIRVTVEAI